jgi:hypothetical protein
VRRCLWLDYDNDGDLDLLAGFLTGDGTSALLRNEGNGNHYLKVRCIGTVSNRDAIGTKVRVFAKIFGEEVQQLRSVSSSGRITTLDVHFGLGDATTIDTLRIEWPSGIVQEFQDVAVDQFLTIEEPLADPVLAIPTWISPTELQIVLSGETGQTYRLENSEDLQTWTTVDTVTLGDPAEQTFTVTNTGALPAVFYRVVEE